jgi:AcrR family transcriptional regulator
MARLRQAGRLRQLAETAADVFIANGYRRTQIADVARALGVAKGTVYLYVESKQALFALALAATDPSWQEPASLPLPTPSAEQMQEAVTLRFTRDGRFEALNEAVARRRCADSGAELEDVVTELYEVLARNRRVIKLVERCAPDLPDLHAASYSVARGALPAQLAEYIDKRQQRGHFRPTADVAITARTLVETVSFWAIHHHWDPAPAPVDETRVCATLVELFRGALLREPGP